MKLTYNKQDQFKVLDLFKALHVISKTKKRKKTKKFHNLDHYKAHLVILRSLMRLAD